MYIYFAKHVVVPARTQVLLHLFPEEKGSHTSWKQIFQIQVPRSSHEQLSNKYRRNSTLLRCSHACFKCFQPNIIKRTIQ